MTQECQIKRNILRQGESRAIQKAAFINHEKACLLASNDKFILKCN